VASLFWILAAAVMLFAIVSFISGAAVTGVVLVVIAGLLGPAGRALHV
jgi:hypothetical protein